MSYRHALAIPLLLTAAACDLGPELTDDIETDSSEVILGDDDWNLIPAFREHPSLHTGTLYGRTTARGVHKNLIGGKDKQCSGFLIDDDIYMTARHCRWDLGSPTTVDAFFGEYGNADGDFGLALDEAKLRLRQIGVPQTTIDGLDKSVYTKWVCDVQPSPSDRDIEYYVCRNNSISWTEGTGANAQTVTLGLKPGHVWRHLNVAQGNRPDDRPIYALSSNIKCGLSKFNGLLSPGVIEDTHEGCNGSSSFDHCFDATTDWVQGSSGGAIVDRTTNTVFGVVNGHNWWWFGDPEDPCEDWSAAENTGTYIGARANDFTSENADGGGWSMGAWSSHAAKKLGGGGGTRRNLFCPNGYLAAGVVGSTSTAGYVGNMGLVCVPHNSLTRYRLDRATVIAGGSHDTGFHAAFNEDFNTYMAEVLSTTRPDTGEQQVMLCPPGYYIKTLFGSHGTYLNRITGLRCEDPQTGKQTMRTMSSYIPGGSIGDAPGGTYTNTFCPADTYFAGMQVHSGWWTDAFQPLCRFED